MSTLANVARYHLVQPFSSWSLPWAVLAFSFVVNLIIFSAGSPRVSRHGLVRCTSGGTGALSASSSSSS